MKYITRETYIGKNLIGQQIVIPAQTYVDTQDNIICYKRLPVCYINSQIGHDYFVWADDGNELLRMEYENWIWFSKAPKEYQFEVVTILDDGTREVETVTKLSKYSQAEITFLRTNYSKYLEEGTAIIFNNEFFKAPIKDLALIAQYFKN